MRRKRTGSHSYFYLVAAVAAVFCLAIAGGYLWSMANTPDGQSDGRSEILVPPSKISSDDWIEDILASMSPTEKIGQMVMAGIQGTEIDDNSRYLLRQFHIGGIILFDRNLESATQTASLTRQLQDYAKSGEAHQKAPLFIGIDEEGGKVCRGRGFIPEPPSQQEIGESGQTDMAREWAEKTAGNLKKLGINVNFAPVADVGTADTRSYSDSPEIVTGFVLAAAEGYEKSGVMYALKHFPGIGKGTVDSHQEVSTVEAPLAVLEQEDLVPFAQVIRQRPKENYFVMVSHLIYPALDEAHSATLSQAVMTGLLREKMGYEGIVITDDMEMGAVANHESFRRLGALSVMAGADIVLICHEIEHIEDIYMGILEAYEAGEISDERLNASVRRILRAKLRER